MNLGSVAQRLLAGLPPRIADAVYGSTARIPPLKRLLDTEYERMLSSTPVPHTSGDLPVFTTLPRRPVEHVAVLEGMRTVARSERSAWEDGRASGAVYHGDSDHIEFLNSVYALHSQSNPLHADIWPSGVKFEAEVVAMTADMLGGGRDSGVVGTITSGGTESIIMAMKAYRDRAGITRPEMVVPNSAHVAFDKAASYLGIKLIRVPVAADFRADVDAMEAAITRRTVVMAGSAPGFPHGVIDPIPELSEIARRRGIGFHTDACLGGFILPWAARLGYDVPDFDFRLPGVTSMSADTHKYGYAAKGTSVVLYRDAGLRRHQYFVASDWPGGLYYSTTMAGSRPGALVATAWAAMVSTGEQGYLEATAAIMEAGTRVREGIRGIPGLRVLGEPLWVVAFTADELDIYEVMARMAERGWSLNGLHHPPAVHIALTLRHTAPGVIEGLITDLRAAVDSTRAAGGRAQSGAAPVYGMAATFPARGAVDDLLLRYVDRLYQVEPPTD